jgi:hypothetical protein
MPKKIKKSMNKPRLNFSQITEASDINVLVQKPNVIDTIANVIVRVYTALIAIARIVKICPLKTMCRIDIKK